MSNRLTFFVSAFFIMQVLSFIIEGESAIATTELAANIDNEVLLVAVISTTGFIATNDFFTLDNEDICYSTTTATTFVVSERGCRGSDSAPHVAGQRVYNDATGLINSLIGFDVLQVLADDGFFKGGIKAFTALPGIAKSVGKMVIWDYSYLEGSMVWLKYALFGISAAMVLDFINLVLRRGGS